MAGPADMTSHKRNISRNSQIAPIEPCLARSTSLNAMVGRVSLAFHTRFGKEPIWIAAAPGRVNVIGEHTDYNDGFVLPMAIDRHIVLAGGPAAGEEFTVYSCNFDDSRSFRADDPDGKQNGDWSNYLRGVVDGCKAAGLWPGAMNIAVLSDVPLGAGLSSSAALEVATATLIEAATGQRLAGTRKPYIAQQAEHEYAGMPCGIMDQFASALCVQDHLMLLDCRSATFQPIPFTDPGMELLIINSNVKHELTGSEYPDRRAQCERAADILEVDALRDVTMEQLRANRDLLDDLHYRRAHHIVSENIRTLQTAEAMAEGDWSRAGQLMYLSQTSMRNAFEITCPELDLLVELAGDVGEAGGLYGARMTGGGFGGCAVMLVETDKVATIVSRISKAYVRRTGIEATAYVSRPVRGAHILKEEQGNGQL